MPLCPQITNTPITVTQTADFTVTSVVPAVPDTADGLATTIDQIVLNSGAVVYYQNDAPTDPPNDLKEGDIWFDTNDGNKQYYYTGTAWVSVQDTAIAAAQSAATAAQTTADGKNRVYRQTTQPTTGPFAEGDLWFDTDDDNRIYRYTSGSWGTAVALGNNALGNLSANKITSGSIDASVITVSNLNAGNISTGTLNADRIASASITGTKIAAGTITASNIATNTITATQIAAGTITATQIASNTITATQISSSYVYAGTINANQINAGTLTGFLIQTSSSTTAVTLDGSTNSMYFKYLGTVYGHILPASSGSVMIHYGATADPTGSTYPQFYVGGSAIYMAQSATRYALVDSSGFDVGGSIDATLDVTAGRDLFTPNHTTVTDAANGRVTVTLGRVTRSTASSQRYKENITPIREIAELDPKKLLDIPVRAFTYREDYLSDTDSRFGALIPGFIAEEVDAVYPTAADYEDGQVESWNDRMIVPGMLALIQDLYKEVQTLKGE